MKPASNQDMQLPFQKTAPQHLLRASFGGLETRCASSAVSQGADSFKLFFFFFNDEDYYVFFTPIE